MAWPEAMPVSDVHWVVCRLGMLGGGVGRTSKGATADVRMSATSLHWGRHVGEPLEKVSWRSIGSRVDPIVRGLR